MLLLLDEVEVPEELVDISVRIVRVSPTVMKKKPIFLFELFLSSFPSKF